MLRRKDEEPGTRRDDHRGRDSRALDPFREIVTRLAQHRVSAAPVLDPEGNVLGVVTEADLLLKQEHPDPKLDIPLIWTRRRRLEREKAAAFVASELMTTPPVTVLPTTTITEAARRMHTTGVKRLPVVDEAGRLVGIVSRADLLKVFTRVPNGKAFDLDDDTRGGQPIWEVKVASGQRQFDLDVTADGARVLNRREDPTPDDDIRKLRSVKVDPPRALRLAAQHQDGQVTDLDLDTTDAGTVVWEVDFRQPNGSTKVVPIHARTGKVVDRPDGS